MIQNYFPQQFQPQALPQMPRSESSQDDSRTTGFSQTRATNRARGQRDRPYTDSRFPRLGIFVSMNEHEYRQHIMDYQTMYSYMSWKNYCEYIQSIHRHNSQQWYQSSGDNTHDKDMHPARHSWFW
jgi:hypothetical protein